MIYHCAGNAWPARSIASPEEDFRSSVAVVQEILEAIRRCSPETHFVMMSSAAVYGEVTKLPVSESERISPISPYGYHKWMCEILCEEYSRVYGVKTSCARVFSAFGPGLKKQIVWDAFVKLSGDESPEFFGTGEEERDFIYIGDLVSALQKIAKRDGERFEAVNVASGESVRIADVVSMVADAADLQGRGWRFSGEVAEGSPTKWVGDVSRLKGLGFERNWTFREGIRETIEWALH